MQQHSLCFSTLVRTVNAASDEQFSMAPPRLQSDARVSRRAFGVKNCKGVVVERRPLHGRQKTFLCVRLRAQVLRRSSGDSRRRVLRQRRRAVVRLIAREAPR